MNSPLAQLRTANPRAQVLTVAILRAVLGLSSAGPAAFPTPTCVTTPVHTPTTTPPGAAGARPHYVEDERRSVGGALLEMLDERADGASIAVTGFVADLATSFRRVDPSRTGFPCLMLCAYCVYVVLCANCQSFARKGNSVKFGRLFLLGRLQLTDSTQ